MPVGKDFDAGTWNEIYEARARLEAIRDRIQPYPSTSSGRVPAYPQDVEPEPPQERVIVHRHSNMGKQEYDLLQQTARGLKHLSQDLTELQARMKPKEKPSTYKGLTT